MIMHARVKAKPAVDWWIFIKDSMFCIEDMNIFIPLNLFISSSVFRVLWSILIFDARMLYSNVIKTVVKL